MGNAGASPKAAREASEKDVHLVSLKFEGNHEVRRENNGSSVRERKEHFKFRQITKQVSAVFGVKKNDKLISQKSVPQNLSKDLDDIVPAISQEQRLQAAILIQRYTRGYLARKKFSAQIKQAVQRAHELKRQNQAATCIQKYVRGRLARVRFAKIVMRSKVAQELVMTETAYVYSLQLIVELFIKPLRLSAKSNNPVITNEHLKNIFSVWEAITQFQQQLLQELQKRFSPWWFNQVIGDLFLNLIPFLKMYSQYANNYHSALATYCICAEKAVFVNFVKSTEASPEMKNQTLKSYLIIPIQRIPRYLLLLREMLKFTEEKHPDYSNLSAALEKLKTITEIIDNRQLDWNRFNEVVRVSQLLDPKIPDLITPQRRLYGEGDARLHQKKLSKRHYFVFNDHILFCSHKNTLFLSNNNSSEKIKLKPEETFYISEIESVEDVDPEKQTERPLFGMRLTKMGDKKNGISIFCDTEESKQKLLDMLCECRAQVMGESSKTLDIRAISIPQPAGTSPPHSPRNSRKTYAFSSRMRSKRGSSLVVSPLSSGSSPSSQHNASFSRPSSLRSLLLPTNSGGNSSNATPKSSLTQKESFLM